MNSLGRVLSIPYENPESVEDFVSKKLEEAVSGCTEGLMVKMLSRHQTGADEVGAATEMLMHGTEKRFIEVLEEDEFGFPVTVRKEVSTTNASADSNCSSLSTSKGLQANSFPSSSRKKMPPMVMTHALYEAGRRSDVWRKVKNDYLDGKSVCDSIDVVPIGAWSGSGRKAAWYSCWWLYMILKRVIFKVCAGSCQASQMRCTNQYLIQLKNGLLKTSQRIL